jgi:hypothetical protein
MGGTGAIGGVGGSGGTGGLGGGPQCPDPPAAPRYSSADFTLSSLWYTRDCYNGYFDITGDRGGSQPGKHGTVTQGGSLAVSETWQYQGGAWGVTSLMGLLTLSMREQGDAYESLEAKSYAVSADGNTLMSAYHYLDMTVGATLTHNDYTEYYAGGAVTRKLGTQLTDTHVTSQGDDQHTRDTQTFTGPLEWTRETHLHSFDIHALTPPQRTATSENVINERSFSTDGKNTLLDTTNTGVSSEQIFRPLQGPDGQTREEPLSAREEFFEYYTNELDGSRNRNNQRTFEKKYQLAEPPIVLQDKAEHFQSLGNQSLQWSRTTTYYPDTGGPQAFDDYGTSFGSNGFFGLSLRWDQNGHLTGVAERQSLPTTVVPPPIDPPDHFTTRMGELIEAYNRLWNQEPGHTRRLPAPQAYPFRPYLQAQ